MSTSNSIDEFNKKALAARQAPPDLTAKLKKELAVDEELVWSGFPTPVYFGPGTLATTLFMIPWTAFAVFWTYGASGGGTNIFGLFGLPFIAIGTFGLLTPIFQYRKLKNTVYGVTNKRALIIADKTITSVTPAKMTEIIRNDRKNGFSDIIFRKYSRYDRDGDWKNMVLGFVNIPNGREAEQAINQLKG